MFQDFFVTKVKVEKEMDFLNQKVIDQRMVYLEFWEEKLLMGDLNEVLARKYRKLWLNDGDLNISFFHNTTKI